MSKTFTFVSLISFSILSYADNPSCSRISQSIDTPPLQYFVTQKGFADITEAGHKLFALENFKLDLNFCINSQFTYASCQNNSAGSFCFIWLSSRKKFQEDILNRYQQTLKIRVNNFTPVSNCDSSAEDFVNKYSIYIKSKNISDYNALTEIWNRYQACLQTNNTWQSQG